MVIGGLSGEAGRASADLNVSGCVTADTYLKMRLALQRYPSAAAALGASS